MPWFCLGCAGRRGGTICKKWCREKYGDAGAERVPPLDGMVFFNDDGSGIPRYELMQQRVGLVRYTPRRVQGPRPQGWQQALEAMAERAATILANGIAVPEC